MASIFTQSSGRKMVHYWNSQSPLERLNFVMNHMNLFWSMGLVTSSEMEIVQRLSEASREYIVGREEKPIFKKINIKKGVEDQEEGQKLRTALEAVFLKTKKEKVH